MTGTATKSFDCFNTAVQLDPNFWQARYLFGNELEAAGRMEEAQDQLYATLSAHPPGFCARNAFELWTGSLPSQATWRKHSTVSNYITAKPNRPGGRGKNLETIQTNLNEAKNSQPMKSYVVTL